jgi:hypothetical protein
MEILKARNRAGLIKGVDIGAEHQLVYQLFGDDTWIFFEATEDSFKSGSGSNP